MNVIHSTDMPKRFLEMSIWYISWKWKKERQKGYFTEVIFFVLLFRIERTGIYMLVPPFCCLLWRLSILVYMINFGSTTIGRKTLSRTTIGRSDNWVLRQLVAMQHWSQCWKIKLLKKIHYYYNEIILRIQKIPNNMYMRKVH